MPKPKFVSAVLILPVRKDGKYLITQRNNPSNPPWHNKWQLAGGGIEYGESPEQALSREAQEELGVSVRIIFPCPLLKTVTYEKGQDDDFPGFRTHISLACYLVDIGDQKIDVSKDDETKAYQWIYPKQVHDLEYLKMTKTLIEEAEVLVNKYKLIK